MDVFSKEGAPYVTSNMQSPISTISPSSSVTMVDNVPSSDARNQETGESIPTQHAVVPMQSEVIELLDDEGNTSEDTESLIRHARHTKRPRQNDEPSNVGEISYHARAAHMPPWMKPSTSVEPTNNVLLNSQTVHTLEQLYQPAPLRLPPVINMFKDPVYLEPTPGFTPTWKDLLLVSHGPNPSRTWKAYRLSLLNVSEFTIAGLQTDNDSVPTSLSGLRAQIKTISKEHGKAYFARNEGDCGKWHIPLGAYHSFYAYLRSDPMCTVEGIPEVQLKIASLGCAQLKKDYPTSTKLIALGVPARLAKSLAPFQRGGVDFVIEKEGRALIADEMGLGKTVQGIASMTVYHEEWPLLVLCPSSARYHWENEFRHWLGKDNAVSEHDGVFDADRSESDQDTGADETMTSGLPMEASRPVMEVLLSSQIHVLTTAKDGIFPNKSTRVVICSYGLAPTLIRNRKIRPGKFKCAIVDESHMLKNKSTQRTSLLLPILCATQRCVLLSGTPAFARPIELWPQLTILGTERHGWWQEEHQFVRKYVKGGNTERRAELHAMLAGTVMIRRMKNDILKSLPPKVREQGVVNVMDDKIRKEMQLCMEALREGKGKLAELARGHTAVEDAGDVPYSAEVAGDSNLFYPDTQRNKSIEEEQLELEVDRRYSEGLKRIHDTVTNTSHQLDPVTTHNVVRQLETRLHQEIHVYYKEKMHEIKSKYSTEGGTVQACAGHQGSTDPDACSRKAVLNHMYKLTGNAKTPLIVRMLQKWLNDPTRGKLCIFAHHLSVLNAIERDAGLSNDPHSKRKYIRIDGSTTPRARQEQINTFQGDPSVRIAVLGITAAGVAVTLTASSTVWFAELFWTPALMVQAEDRCHRIGQQAQVHCLYFVAKGTLDELLWKLLEQKFQDLGEFVEGKEKLKLVVHRKYSTVKELMASMERQVDDLDDDLESSYADGDVNSDRAFSPFGDFESEIEHEIEELGLSEQAMVRALEADDEEPDADTNEGMDAKPAATETTQSINKELDGMGKSENEAICLSDDEDDTAEPSPQPATEDSSQKRTFGFSEGFPRMRLYKMMFTGPTFGLQLSLWEGRLVVTARKSVRIQQFGPESKPDVGDILAAINGQVLYLAPNMAAVLHIMQLALSTPPVEITFAEDEGISDRIKTLVLQSQETTALHQNAATKRLPPDTGTQESTPQEHDEQVSNEVIDLMD